MNAQKRRMKQLEHRKEIERLLETRRQKYEEERASELAEQVCDLPPSPPALPMCMHPTRLHAELAEQVSPVTPQ